MDNLSMIKAIADLEGLGIDLYLSHKENAYWCCEDLNCEYDPIYDGHLNRKLILKYKVRLIKYHRSVTITQENGGFGLKCIRATYRTDEDLPYAVVECILKANGLWVTNNK